MDIHSGTLIENFEPYIAGKRLNKSLIIGDYIDAFILGYCDRNCEELDDCKYSRVINISTVFEMFYKAGYIHCIIYTSLFRTRF